MEELQDYEQLFTGGSIERSAFSDLRESGSLTFSGRELPDKHDLVRVYYEFVDSAGETTREPLATMFFASIDPTYEGARVHGSASIESVLRVLASKTYGRPYTVAKGTNAIAKAIALCESVGLKTNAAECEYVLTKDHVFDENTAYLTMVNWLTSAAGYAGVFPDAYGIIQIVPYVEPNERDPLWTFRDDERSIMRPEVIVSDNSAERYNAVRLYYETEEETLWASAVNNDPLSDLSVASRGYEITLAEQVTELSGSTQAERISNLKAMAKERLLDNSAGIEYVDLHHPYVPIKPNDAILIDYRMAGKQWPGSVTNQTITLEASLDTATRARRYLRAGLEVDVEGGAL